MIDLVEFLRARLDELEAKALRARDGERTEHVDADDDIEPLLFNGEGVFDLPARVLREVEAKRRIIEDFEHWQPHDPGFDALEPAIQLLALPYADHEDFKDEWRV